MENNFDYGTERGAEAVRWARDDCPLTGANVTSSWSQIIDARVNLLTHDKTATFSSD